jgi:hypothetical protein
MAVLAGGEARLPAKKIFSRKLSAVGSVLPG